MEINLPPKVQSIGKKAINLAKRIRPGHLMFGTMLVMTCLNRCSPSSCQPHQPQSKDAAWAYEAGQKRIRDSLKIVELEQKLAADSMKIYHLSEKTKLSKVIK